jgi:hypothetical protein
MNSPEEQYSAEEAARRRDEVIRRMANTPPQPRATPKTSAKEAKASASDHGSARRGRAASSDSSAEG